MLKLIGLLFLAALVCAGCVFVLKKKSGQIVDVESQRDKANTIHNLSARTLLDGKERPLSDYKNKVLLIVNTASKCGLTPQYKDLQALHESHSDKGLSILGFPSNDFLKQEPGTEAEIAAFCQKNYGVEFDMFEKVKVKGNNKHPVYEFLTNKEKNGVMDSKVLWNFQKYLLDKEGKLVAQINPKMKVTDPAVIHKIDSLLTE